MTLAADPTPRRTAASRRVRWAAVTVAATAALALLVVYALREVFGPLLLALAVAYVLEPAVRLLTDRGSRRLTAVVVVFLLSGLVAALAILALAFQGARMLEWLTAPDGLVREGIANLTRLLEAYRGRLGDLGVGDRVTQPEFWQPIVQPVANLSVALLGSFLTWINLFGVLLLAPIYTFYLMLELPRIWSFVREHLPAHDRERTLRVLAAIHVGFSGFLRGRVVIALLKGALTSIALTILGLPFAWIVGMTAGLLSILPLVGPLLGFLIAAGVALAHEAALGPVVGVAIVFAVVEGIENFVLTPWVMRQGVSLHPLTVLFCIFFWGAALGAFGALVAVPLTLVVKIVLREYVLPSVETLAQRA